MVKGQNLGTQKQRETERRIQSRWGSRPSHAMGAKDQRGNLLPSRDEVKEEEQEGGLSPPCFRWRRSAAGAIIITAIFTNTTVIFTNISITFPLLYSAVHSPATRCTLYLNMVLYASYYYPMMCCHPMMSE